jgi:hypothetical protein
MKHTQLLNILDAQHATASAALEEVAVMMEAFVVDYLHARHDSYYAQAQGSKSGKTELKKRLKKQPDFVAPNATLSYSKLSFRLRLFTLTTKSTLISEDNPPFPVLYVVSKLPGQKISEHIHHNSKEGYSPSLTVKRSDLAVPKKDHETVKGYIRRLNHLNYLARGFKTDFINARERYLFTLEHLR